MSLNHVPVEGPACVPGPKTSTGFPSPFWLKHTSVTYCSAQHPYFASRVLLPLLHGFFRDFDFIHWTDAECDTKTEVWGAHCFVLHRTFVHFSVEAIQLEELPSTGYQAVVRLSSRAARPNHGVTFRE